MEHPRSPTLTPMGAGDDQGGEDELLGRGIAGQGSGFAEAPGTGG
jgi:hypothetical protein